MGHVAHTVMLQGTASGVGKSTLCYGLCRLLRRRGIEVAPYKAQNLSDNAHVLPDGRKMARSQAIAAAACGIEPEPDMNPVLIEPGDEGCTVTIDGHTADRFDVNLCRKAARSAFTRLSRRFEAVIAEGAGSPVELNLRSNDIMNMDFACWASVPVILVADIRRGGVFASLFGTLRLLRAEERALVKGMIVNDFYGDPSSFSQGRALLEDVCEIPVLGVIPHLDIHLEDEDSLPGDATLTRAHIEKLVPAGMNAFGYQLNQIDRVADALERHLDTAALEHILFEGV